MRSLVLVGVLGSFLLAAGVQAQSLAEHAAAASGATIGTAAGKPLSSAITKIFGQADSSTKKAANADTRPARILDPEAPPKRQYAPQGGGTDPIPYAGESAAAPAPSRHGGFTPRPAGRQLASVNARPQVAYIPEPPPKEPTAEEFASVQVGVTAKELFSTLGPPESKVTIPDDGHLLEICQYWSKGKQLGTIRVDNGQVIQIDTRSQN